jgi:cell division protein FtsX
MRHSLAEGWLLLRRRAVVSATLSLGLAIPICLAGLTVTLSSWIRPLVGDASPTSVVAVLLHPELGEARRRDFLASLRTHHPEWGVRAVSPHELRQRLVHWFPYLDDLLRGEDDRLLPHLVEITTVDPTSTTGLEDSDEVIAVGPRASVEGLVRTVAQGLGWLLAGVSIVLVLSAALLASVWVHLELYRHANEISVMRLIGATEGAIRGPLVVAVTVPGVLAALLAPAATVLLVRALARGAAVLGLPSISVAPGVLAAQAGAAVTLPVLAAVWVLARHAHDGVEAMPGP